jgi:hypothetical protein
MCVCERVYRDFFIISLCSVSSVCTIVKKMKSPKILESLSGHLFHIADNITKHEEAAVILSSSDIPYGHFILLYCLVSEDHCIKYSISKISSKMYSYDRSLICMSCKINLSVLQLSNYFRPNFIIDIRV